MQVIRSSWTYPVYVSHYTVYYEYLHEESRDKGLPDIEVVIFAGELGTGPAKVETVHDSRELFPYIVR